MDEEGFDDFTRVRELLGLATGRITAGTLCVSVN